MAIRLVLVLFVALAGLTACEKDTSMRDKFVGTYLGQRICTDPAFLEDDTSEVTITIETVEWSVDTLQITMSGTNVDSINAVQKAGYGGTVLVFQNTSFAGELSDNGDTLTIHDVALGASKPCVAVGIRQ